MFVQFFIAMLAIVAIGPLENEGGRKAMEAKGVKPAVEAAIEGRDKVTHKLQSNYNQ
jgi:hypothetical protein